MIPAKNILLQILKETTSKGISLGKTHLVKLLYLTEVEAFRETSQRLTELNWVFYLYGPYAYELEGILDEPEFQKESFKTTNEKDFVRLTLAEPASTYGQLVDTKISLVVKKVVGQWANKPLSELLDYVYFETEPMQHVRRRGEKLDFNTIQMKTGESSVIPINASSAANEKIAAMRARLSSFFESMGKANVPDEPLTSEYDNAVIEWDEENHEAIFPSNLIVKINNQPNSSDTKGS